MIQHFFFSCQFTQLVWQVFFVVFNPPNISNLFGKWLSGLNTSLQALTLVGGYAILVYLELP
jgi:hypothetical protein